MIEKKQKEQSSYHVKLIGPKKKSEILKNIDCNKLYTRKASIHGVCVKIFCSEHQTLDMWEENFNHMPEDIRPHARLFAINTDTKKMQVFYEPHSKTVFIYNCQYYGWIKSIALALSADYLYDSPSVENKRYPIHGSLIDVAGRAVCIIGRPKSGKTTLTYGLLCEREDTNFVTDDWFFVRFMGSGIRAFSAEKNSYAGSDIADNWPQLKSKLSQIKKDSRGRAVVDVAQLFSQNRIREQTELQTIVLLTRDPKLCAFERLQPQKALELMTKWDFCNPHQLVRNKEKKESQIRFFKTLFTRVECYLLNTIETPKQSLARVERLIENENC
jgi:hypothetical protein